jgi:hypothetical protein
MQCIRATAHLGSTPCPNPSRVRFNGVNSITTCLKTARSSKPSASSLKRMEALRCGPAELRARKLSKDGQAGAAAIWRCIAGVIRHIQADETDPSAE